eukprot:gb/GFBE01011025.1/.p1 GENE.gb/GFBE01011025.1/~~gb/GFBE01011025.1/.p1  ORF type:complete len:193 (+),score=27.01 gb/GFBE01011025.1/:1-579(+)
MSWIVTRTSRLLASHLRDGKASKASAESMDDLCSKREAAGSQNELRSTVNSSNTTGSVLTASPADFARSDSCKKSRATDPWNDLSDTVSNSTRSTTDSCLSVTTADSARSEDKTALDRRVAAAPGRQLQHLSQQSYFDFLESELHFFLADRDFEPGCHYSGHLIEGWDGPVEWPKEIFRADVGQDLCSTISL